MKKTLVLGATPNPERYAYQATQRLLAKGHEVVLVGIKSGQIAGIDIHTQTTIHPNIDTITLYVGSERQQEWYDYILQTNPARIIFNPGTENPELVNKAQAQGIETLYACTLVMLASNQY
ncbi:MAG TPA: CoA-binding protein [Microscillaceae bacterium]|jgi:predicted CoA-binding protein|nr:CoA-binding protein [Microscillaceae bacterium]